MATNYAEMSGKILRYSPDGASLVSDTMDAYWSTLYEMQNPVADVRDDRAVIADQDGTLLEMFDKDGRDGQCDNFLQYHKSQSVIQRHGCGNS